jgi:hypothetical protein
MSDDRSFMDKVLGRDEQSTVDTRDRDAETREVPTSRDHQDHLTDDRHDVGARRADATDVDGPRDDPRHEQDQLQGQEQQRDVRVVDVRRDAGPQGGIQQDGTQQDGLQHDGSRDSYGDGAGHDPRYDPQTGGQGARHADPRPDAQGGVGRQDQRSSPDSEWLEPTDSRGAGSDRTQSRSETQTQSQRTQAAHTEDDRSHGDRTQRGTASDLPALVPGDRAEDYRRRWESVKAGFVDEPRGAVKDANELVGRVLDDVAELFSRQRSELEADLRNEQASTEDLRLALGRYRSFFDRLLTL